MWNQRTRLTFRGHMGWLRLVGSLNLQVSFAKKPYKRDIYSSKRRIILRSLLIVATPYTHDYIHEYICTRVCAYIFVYINMRIGIYIHMCTHTSCICSVAPCHPSLPVTAYLSLAHSQTHTRRMRYLFNCSRWLSSTLSFTLTHFSCTRYGCLSREYSCNILQFTATHCDTPQTLVRHIQDCSLSCGRFCLHTTHCNTLQHTATHCNTLQHTHQAQALLVPFLRTQLHGRKVAKQVKMFLWKVACVTWFISYISYISMRLFLFIHMNVSFCTYECVREMALFYTYKYICFFWNI